MKRAAPTAGKEENGQQQATSTKRAGDEDAGVRSILVQEQRQLPTIHKITKTVAIPQAQFMPQCHTEALEIRPSRRPWSSHRSAESIVDRVVDVPVVARDHVSMVQTAQNTVEAPQANHIDRTADVSVMMSRQVSTTQTAQKQRQVPVIQKVLRTAEVPQVQQIEEEETVAVVFHKSGFRDELWSRSQTCQ